MTKDNISINIITYGTKYNKPIPKYDIGYSCKRFPNPHSKCPNSTGLDKRVREFVLTSDCERFIEDVSLYIESVVTSSKFEKPYLMVSFSCYGGRHRSVVVAEEVAARLREKGYRVVVEHRELSVKS